VTFEATCTKLCLFHQVVAVMLHDVDDISSQNAGIVLYRNVKDTVRTHFAETYGAGAFLEAPLQAYYGMQCWGVLVFLGGREKAYKTKTTVTPRIEIFEVSSLTCNWH